MRNSDWRQVETIFHEALDLEGEGRATYLGEACSGIESLRGEVESLLLAYESRSSFMERPAFKFGLEVLHRDGANSMVGRTVGSYKVIQALGKGGMGEVYLAEDSRLGRKVALKFLSAEFVGDNWAKRQLIKEAQAVAMLDHPNICPVYGFEEYETLSYIVMQYVDGQTLAQLIKTSSFKHNERTALARQIVGALIEAHAHGIVHRDIKPKNIMVTPSGQVKVLDFGLAKISENKRGLVNGADSLSHLSQAGMILGTIAYMSPEQLRAEKLDYRSDIFSMGTVLYEIFSGINPFQNSSNAEIISAILTVSPQPLGQIASGCSRDLEQIVQKCLRKDREMRYHSASELLLELESLEVDHTVARRWTSYLSSRVVACFAIFVLLIVGLAFFFSETKRNRRTLAVITITCDGLSTDTKCPGPELTTSLVSGLSHHADVTVKRSDITPAADGPGALTPQKIGGQLNADVVLFGRVRQRGNGLILQVRLENVKDGSQISDDEYLVDPSDSNLLEEELSLRIGLYLQLQATDEQRGYIAAVAAHQKRDPIAFDLYIRGRSYWNKRDRVNIQKAIDLFREATDRDPLFAQAFARMADCYVLMNSLAYGSLSTKEAMTKAEWAARQALEIDDNLPEAHTSLGVVQLRYHWNWAEAEKEFRRALEIDPRYGPGHYWYSSLLMVTGRVSEAIAESEKARDCDPFSPLMLMNLGRAYYRARDYDRAIDHLQKTLKEFPNNSSSVMYTLGYVYLQKEMYSEAIALYEEISATNKWLAAAPLGYAYARSGRRRDALRVLAELEEQSKQGIIPALERAIIYIGLNDKDQAFYWLEKSYEERFGPIIALTCEPIFDSLRPDPRFGVLARKINLIPARATPQL